MNVKVRHVSENTGFASIKSVAQDIFALVKKATVVITAKVFEKEVFYIV